MTTNSNLLSKFIQEVETKGSIQEAIQRGEELYALKIYRISQISASDAVKLFDSIQIKFYKAHLQIISGNWHENELRIFVWVLVCYIYLHEREIQDLGEEDWSFFQTIFDKKDPKLFQYQCKALSSNANGKIWSYQEELLLLKVMESKVNKTKWNQISKELFQLSCKKYFRTAKQCRQKWNNHLDPSKIKGYWRPQQCLKMFQFVKEHGKKWASLVKALNDTRNEHSVKNKFNSIMKKHQKHFPHANDEGLYKIIIQRIKQRMQNKFVYENLDISFDLDQYNSSINIPKQEVSNKMCHSVTKNFIKILRQFNTENCIPVTFTIQQKQQQNFSVISSSSNKNLNYSSLISQSMYKNVQNSVSIHIEDDLLPIKDEKYLSEKYFPLNSNKNQFDKLQYEPKLINGGFAYNSDEFDNQIIGHERFSYPHFDHIYNKEYF